MQWPDKCVLATSLEKNLEKLLHTLYWVTLFVKIINRI